MQVSGVVASTYTKSIPIKRGPRAGQDGTVYHTVLDDGTDINCGWKNPGHEEGAFVRLEVENTNFGIKLSSNKGGGAQQAASPTASNPSAKPVANNAAAGFPVRKGTKDISIIRQNSAQHASRIVAAEIAQGMLTSAEDIDARFFDLVYQITDFSTGHREENIAKAMQAVAEDDE